MVSARTPSDHPPPAIAAGPADDARQGDLAPRFRHGKKVAIVIRLLVNRSGGAERIYCELANMLTARGYEVTCLHYDAIPGKPFFAIDRRVELINLYPETPPLRHRLAHWFSRRFFVPHLPHADTCRMVLRKNETTVALLTILKAA